MPNGTYQEYEEKVAAIFKRKTGLKLSDFFVSGFFKPYHNCNYHPQLALYEVTSNLPHEKLTEFMRQLFCLDSSRMCNRCESELDKDGKCTDETCPFSSCQQHEEKGWEGHPERDQMIEQFSYQPLPRSSNGDDAGEWDGDKAVIEHSK